MDAVLSEDVDTLMFGCGLTLRNWSSEGTRGNKSPTHVSIYTAEATKQGCGLDSDGMILIALMSGGDYVPAGVSKCGIKIAYEAARAGFGHDLCRLSKKDVVGFRQWRKRLNHELKSNSSGYFRTKHKTLDIPDNFPDVIVLGYYKEPVVSTAEKIFQLSSTITWGSDIDINGLRRFTAEAFEWNYLVGAKKFLRGFAPAFLIHRLCKTAQANNNSVDSSKTQEEERKLVSAICGQRCHFTTDGIPELRVKYTPNDIVRLNLSLEETDSSTMEQHSDSESDHSEQPKPREAKTVARSTYDPEQPEKIWILESFAKLGVPLLVEHWEKDVRNSTLRKSKKQMSTKQRSIDSFLKVSKVATRIDMGVNTIIPDGSRRDRSLKKPEEHSTLTNTAVSRPPCSRAKAIDMMAKPKSFKIDSPKKNDTMQIRSKSKPTEENCDSLISNIETGLESLNLSNRPLDTFNIEIPSNSRYSALGIYGSSGGSTVDDIPRSPKGCTFASPDTSSSSKADSKISSPLRDDEGIGSPSINNSTKGKPIGEAPLHFSLDYIQASGSSIDGSYRPGLPEFSPTSPSNSFPSPSSLWCPSTVRGSGMKINSGIAIITPSSPTEARENRRRLIKLRESIAGAWRVAESWEAEGVHKAPVYQDVETVDLTSNRY